MHSIPELKKVDRWTEKRAMFGVYDNIGILGKFSQPSCWTQSPTTMACFQVEIDGTNVMCLLCANMYLNVANQNAAQSYNCKVHPTCSLNQPDSRLGIGAEPEYLDASWFTRYFNLNSVF